MSDFPLEIKTTFGNKLEKPKFIVDMKLLKEE